MARLLENGTDKRLLEDGTSFRLFEDEGGGGPSGFGFLMAFGRNYLVRSTIFLLLSL